MIQPVTLRAPFSFLLLLFLLTLLAHSSAGVDILSAGQSISGNQTLSSPGGIFELGFFTLGNSRNYYIGIWYKKLQKPNKTIVWVANRNNPITKSPLNYHFKLLEHSNLALLDENKTLIWSSGSNSREPNSTVALLLDNGNFVIRGKNSSLLTWQSFDYPTNTWLPGGKIGYNKLTKESQILTAWRSSENPEASKFSVEVEKNGTSHILVWNRTEVYWSSGQWTGKVFQFVPEIALDLYVKNMTYISNENESYFTYEAAFPTALTRFVIDVTGQLRQFVLANNFQNWIPFWVKPPNPCEVFRICGAFSKCSNLDYPFCSCMEGFEPKIAENWELDDHSDGCVRRNTLRCENDTFSRLPDTRLPTNSEALRANSIGECELACLRSCSCTGYTYDNSGGCLAWRGDLYNLQQLDAGKDFHFRVSIPEESLITNTSSSTQVKKKSMMVWVVFGVLGGFLILLSAFLVIFLVAKRKRSNRKGKSEERNGSLRFFKYNELRVATKNFSEKLGEGGFGSVLKGTLPNLSVVAVKKLKNLEEEESQEKQFRAEVSTIGLIQHINLVRLLGFSIKGTRRFLVYEYMINHSLESHLFSRKNPNYFLDWKNRYNIALGTARGLAYLHDECRDCIVHCDIKPENILLDEKFNPKVGDFGLAKLIGREFSRVLTTVRGTRGYLAPEWISGEAITPKADVFSFGMVLLEIVSGKRNRDLYEEEEGCRYFPALVAKCLSSGEDVIIYLDRRLEGEADVSEVRRVCQIACWCLQDDDKDRPRMGDIVKILEGVLQLDDPPIPRFLQNLLENQQELVYFDSPTH